MAGDAREAKRGRAAAGEVYTLACDDESDPVVRRRYFESLLDSHKLEICQAANAATAKLLMAHDENVQKSLRQEGGRTHTQNS